MRIVIMKVISGCVSKEMNVGETKVPYSCVVYVVLCPFCRPRIHGWEYVRPSVTFTA